MSFWEKNPVANIGYVGALLIAEGLVYSPVLQSIGVAMIFIHALANRNFDFKSRNAIYSYLLLSLFGISLVSGLWADNHVEFWKKITVKLPLLLLPLGLLTTNVMSKKQFQVVLFVFVLAVFSAGVVTLVNYLIHYTEVNAQLLHSKPIYVFYAVIPAHEKLNHIYYSILMAFAIGCCVKLFHDEFLPTDIGSAVFIILGIGLLIMLHTIAARTGLASFYIAALIVPIWFVVTQKQYGLGMSIAGGLGLLLMLAWFFLPSWHNRFTNTQEDLQHLKEGKNINHYSISMRMEAIKTAWKIYERHVFLGVGEGDLDGEMINQYKMDNSNLLPENRKLPHNQFLQQLTTTGIIGLLILLAVCLMPFISRAAFQDPFLLYFLSLCLVAFQVESVMERQVGITFFAFFYLILTKRTLIKSI